MIPRPTTLRHLACAMLSSIASVHAQNPVPIAPPPPQLSKEKAAEAAAAVQAPIIPSAPKVLKPVKPENIPTIPDIRARPSVPVGSPPAILQPPPSTRPAAPQLPPVIRGPESDTKATPPPAQPLPTPPPIGSMSKEQALDAATKPRMEGKEAPRIPLPSDKLPVTTSTSSSGQFRVSNPDFELRSRMSSHLDQVAKELRDVLHDAEPHVIPINVRLTRGEEAARAINAGTPPVTVGITEVEGGGFHLQLDIHEAPALTLTLIRQETVRLLLAERILRGHTKITQPQNRLLLPDWVFTGVLQAMDFRAAARPPTMFAAIFQSGKIYGIEEIIAVSPTQMDSLSRGIYETSCGALVMALVDQPDGGRRFNKFLNSLNGSSASERDLLTSSYPGFAASASSLNKWWALQMATLAKRSLSDPLTADESLAVLEKAITISYPAKPEDVPKDLKKRPFVQPATLFSAPAVTAKKPHPDDIAEATGSVRVPEKTSSSKPKDSAKPSTTAETKEAEEETDAADASVSKKAGSPWLRYVTFGLMGSKKEGDTEDEPKEDKADKPKEEKASAEVTSADMPPKEEKTETDPEEDSKPGFFNRVFGLKKDPAAESRQKAVDEAARAEKAKLAAETKAKEEAEKEAAAKAKAEADTKAKAGAEEAMKPAEGEKVAEEKPKEEPKPGFFSRLRSSKKPEAEKPAEKPAEEPANTDAEQMADEAAAKAKAEADAKAKALAEKEAQAKADAEKKAAAEKKAEADKKAAAEKESKKPAQDEPKEEAKEKAPAKPSGLNPLNWFRGKKASEEPEKTEKDAKEAKSKDSEKPKDEEQASWIDLLPSPLAVVHFHVQPVMELWNHFFPSTTPRFAILDFLKRKKPDEEKAKPTEPETPKPAAPPAPAPAKKKKSTPTSSTPPKTTNPNSRPAARPVQPADGSRRTTNPNAKPLELPKVPTATTPTASDDNISTLPAGTVLVELHVEDYKHLLKNPDRAKILQHNIVSLRALENRVSVLMRPVVIGYLDVMLALQSGKSGDEIDKRLAQLRAAAVIAAQKTKTVRDYLDFYEANETDKLSGKFEDFLNLPSIIQNELPPREDPIARYLDAIDKEFSK